MLPCFMCATLGVQMTEWRNIAKTTVWFSSTMEKAMIQMTWPDDNVLDDIWVKVRVCSMVLSFSRRVSAQGTGRQCHRWQY